MSRWLGHRLEKGECRPAATGGLSRCGRADSPGRSVPVRAPIAASRWSEKAHARWHCGQRRPGLNLRLQFRRNRADLPPGAAGTVTLQIRAGMLPGQPMGGGPRTPLSALAPAKASQVDPVSGARQAVVPSAASRPPRCHSPAHRHGPPREFEQPPGRKRQQGQSRGLRARARLDRPAGHRCLSRPEPQATRHSPHMPRSSAPRITPLQTSQAARSSANRASRAAESPVRAASSSRAAA